MPKYCVCIDMMFGELPFMERIGAAAACGFHAVELWRWSRRDIDELKREAQRCGSDIVMINVDSRDETASEALWQGIISAGRGAFIDAVWQTMDVCRYLGVSNALALPGNTRRDTPIEAQREELVTLLQEAAQIASRHGVMLILEPLNTYSRPEVLISRARDGFDIVKATGSDSVRLLYDTFHQQQMEGNMIRTIRENIDLIGHIQIADVPGRHEPGTGEINFGNVLGAIDEAGYLGYVGLEYIPSGQTEKSFGFLQRRLNHE